MVKDQQKVWWGVAMVLLMLAGAALRFWGAQNISLDVDEAITISAARGLLATGHPVIQASGLYYGRDVLGTLTTAASLRVFGVSEWAARLPMIVMGIATIPLTYFLARRLKISHLWAYLAALTVTVSGWEIYYSHSARMYQEQQFFVVLTAFLAIKVVEKFSWTRFGITMVTALAATFAQRSAIVLFPVLLVLFVWNQRSAIRRWMKSGVNRSWVWGLSLVLLFLLIIGEWQMGLLSNSWRYILGTDQNPFNKIAIGFVPIKHLWRAYPVWLIGMLLSWVWVKRRPGLQVLSWITWSVFISVDVLIYPSQPDYRIRYFYAVIPLFFCLASFSLDQFWQWVKQRETKTWVQYVFAGLLVIVLFFESSTLNPADAYVDQPEWNRVKGIEAPVVIAHPTATAEFYLGHVEYWLVSHKGEMRTYSEHHADIYAGAQVLLDPNELQQVLTTKHGIVVLETNRLKFISHELQVTLKANAQKDLELSTDLLQIWRF